VKPWHGDVGARCQSDPCRAKDLLVVGVETCFFSWFKMSVCARTPSVVHACLPVVRKSTQP
ncbi:hypothetical protein A2U01_0092922, partial [Trifolium medium]|nr:hypothetical protein [Trifolium medium]